MISTIKSDYSAQLRKIFRKKLLLCTLEEKEKKVTLSVLKKENEALTALKIK